MLIFATKKSSVARSALNRLKAYIFASDESRALCDFCHVENSLLSSHPFDLELPLSISGLLIINLFLLWLIYSLKSCNCLILNINKIFGFLYLLLVVFVLSFYSLSVVIHVPKPCFVPRLRGFIRYCEHADSRDAANQEQLKVYAWELGLMENARDQLARELLAEQR